MGVSTQRMGEKGDAAKEKLPEIIEDAFNHHDSNEDGVLDEEESNDFFEHFVERFVDFGGKIALKAFDNSIELEISMAENFDGPEAAAQAKKEIEGKRKIRKELNK